ncbi:hypothetical protein MTO96_006771 [Rhipicephalus appendiculatus]
MGGGKENREASLRQSRRNTPSVRRGQVEGYDVDSIRAEVSVGAPWFGRRKPKRCCDAEGRPASRVAMLASAEGALCTAQTRRGCCCRFPLCLPVPPRAAPLPPSHFRVLALRFVCA